MAALEELTERLEQAAGRIRGTPIGKELLDIARQLRERCAEEAQPPSTGEAPAEDAAAAALAPELQRTVDRLLEEREELRRTFGQQVTSAMDAQACAERRAERYRLLAESAESPDGLAAQFALALREESEAARAARAGLQEQVEVLRGELAAERSTARCLRAELTALRAMSREGRAEAPARHGRRGPEAPPGEGEAGGPPPSASPPSASPPSASPAQTPPPGSPREGGAGADPEPAWEPPVEPASSESDRLLMRPRRSMLFAGRDFSEDAGAAPHPWRAEVVELDERASREGWKARWSEGLEPGPDAPGKPAAEGPELGPHARGEAGRG